MAYVHAEQIGTVYSNGYYYYCKGRVTILEQNAVNNTTKFKVELLQGHKARSETGGVTKTWGGTVSSRYIRLDGNTHSYGNYQQDVNNWNDNEFVALVSDEFTVSHDNNGNKGIDLWLGAYASAGGHGPGTCRVTSNDYAWWVNLPAIDRSGPGCDFNISQTTTNSLKLNIWSGGAGCDWAQYRINGGNWIDCATNTTITDLQPNTSYNIQTRLRKQSNQVWSESGVKTYTTHPNTVSVTTLVATPIDPFTVVVSASTNAANVTDKLYIRCGNQQQEFYGGDATATFTVDPETTYNVSAWATTVRSGAQSNTVSTSVTTPADAYCRVISPTGIVSSKKKMYLIDTLGIVTEIKKDNVHILLPSGE